MMRLFDMPPLPPREPDDSEPEPWDGYEGFEYDPDEAPDFVRNTDASDAPF